MTLRTVRSSTWLDEGARTRLDRRIAEGLRRARSLDEPVLVSVTAPLSSPTDPSGAVAASRSVGEPWFCMEQPDRDAIALAGLGSVHTMEAEGEHRFADIARRWRTRAAAALSDETGGAPGSGLIAVGGVGFSPTSSGGRAWRGFAAASLVVPEVSLARRGDRTWITLNAEISPDDRVEAVYRRLQRRLDGLVDARLPLLDPSPVGEYEVVSSMPPAHFEQAVARAVHRIVDGEFEKVVLAREVDVHAPVDHDPAAVLGILRTAFPTSFVYAVGRGEATFLGATPELLIRRQGQRASTVALAGSTRRSADPAVDDHLGEQLLRSDKDRRENAIVARRIARSLRPHSVWVTATEPDVIKVANIQHLAAPIRAQLAASIDVVTLAGMLHPTPAVGAEPASALAVIPALEGFDRGWYSGAVGWTDAAGDGEFCVALRCALLRGHEARCFAGCGIVRDSDPSAELAESEMKLGVMLPVLAG